MPCLPQGLALTLPSLSPEFGISAQHVRYTTAFLYIGLSIGSVGWGFLSDIFGRRIAFNSTLFICGLFGFFISFGTSWIATALLVAGMAVGVGGNLPVDGALYLEFLPAASNRLLTLLSAWWPVGQLFSSLCEICCTSRPRDRANVNAVAWALIPGNSCEAELLPCTKDGPKPCCESKDNRGWRYLMACLGIFTLVMFGCRFFLFHLYESPKFLLSRKRQAEAIDVVQAIARYNGTQTWLDEKAMDDLCETSEEEMVQSRLSLRGGSLAKFSGEKLTALFKDRKMGITSVLLWIIWGT